MEAETITHLEMVSPGELVPARDPGERIELQEVGPDTAPLIGSTYRRIGAPLGWSGRMAWTNDQWRAELSQPGMRAFLARVQTDIAGLAQLEFGSSGDVGIIVFGLVPEFVGRGFGGAFLSLVTELAWKHGGLPTRRVLVQTSSGDHPHALPNYERRGFRVSRRERRQIR
jgi:GNAT superfamily N-acetyltransferase